MTELSTQEKDRRLEFTAHLLEKLTAVNGFFITAGYGTFFGIWAISKDSLGIHERLWACLFLLMSATLFIIWHVVGMVTFNLVMQRVVAEPAEGWTGRATTALRESMVRTTKRFGPVVTFLTLILALAGIGTLAAGIIRAL